MEIENLFNFFYNEVNSTKTMMDKVMVNRCTLFLLLQAIFFMMQNVGIPFQNHSTKSWNSTRNNVAKQMHCKFKLENTKKKDFQNLYFQKNTI